MGLLDDLRTLADAVNQGAQAARTIRDAGKRLLEGAQEAAEDPATWLRAVEVMAEAEQRQQEPDVKREPVRVDFEVRERKDGAT